MKTNIKIKVTPEQSAKIQEICFANGVTWESGVGSTSIKYTTSKYLYIYDYLAFGNMADHFNAHKNTEVDADLFIRTNGTCEEDQCLFKVGDRVQHKTGRLGTVIEVNNDNDNDNPSYAIVVKYDIGKTCYCKDGKFTPSDPLPSIVPYKQDKVILVSTPTSNTSLYEQFIKQQGEPMKLKFFKVFNKDNTVNTQGLMYQSLENTDPRPFVQKLVQEEADRIKQLILAFKPKAYNYNIKLASLTQQLAELSQSIETVTPEIAVMFYQYQKELKNKEKYLWIAKYLTKENLNTQTLVTLFQSNKITIWINEGILLLRENSKVYKVPIRYNKVTNKFGI